ncbi:hypothetical protein [Chryseobacterium terrae]|uniref:Uncharacterized protein n=1 Tax=Chryseobacterium terrae TaxID=3163299 RepID=A0ABW8Y0T7_9FLAO
MKLQHYILISIFPLGILFYFIVFEIKWQNSVLDIPNQQNDKIINMMNIAIDKEIDNHTKSSFSPGLIPESRQSTIDFLKQIKSIESYTRYGVESSRARNNLELKIVFNNGKEVSEVYTGQTCSSYIPCLLIKAELKDGKAVKVFTNGLEKKGSPDWISNDLNLLIDKSISYDIQQNPTHYFPPSKTQSDFEKEWENQK